MIKKAEPPYVPMGKQAFNKFMEVLPMELMEQATGGKLPALAYPEWQQIAAELDAKIERMTAAILAADSDAETVVKATMIQEGAIKVREALTQGKTTAEVNELTEQVYQEFVAKYPEHDVDPE